MVGGVQDGLMEEFLLGAHVDEGFEGREVRRSICEIHSPASGFAVCGIYLVHK